MQLEKNMNLIGLQPPMPSVTAVFPCLGQVRNRFRKARPSFFISIRQSSGISLFVSRFSHFELSKYILHRLIFSSLDCTGFWVLSVVFHLY